MIHTDLHMHSAYSSDGEFTPSELVAKCVAAGVETFALTDHNSTRGVGEAVFAAAKAGIGCIPGIEIDCNYRGTDLHLLGYGVDYGAGDFRLLEEEVAAKVMASFGEMVDNLRRLGFVVDGDAVLLAAGGGLPTGELIAEVMLSDRKYASEPLVPYMEGGARSDMPYINFYLDYFAQSRPAHVPIRYMDFGEAVNLVRENGGVPVVAHPGLNLNGRETVAAELLAAGAQGLEVFNNYHTDEQRACFAQLVSERGVLMTCGSDFHGKTKPRIGVGQFGFDAHHAERLAESIGRLKA